MQTIFSILDSIRAQKSDTNHLIKQEKLLILKLNKVINEIHNLEDFDLTQASFDLLEKAQTEIAKLLFKEKFQFSQGIRRFVADFDRADDLETRGNLFKKIKNHEYSIPQ